MMAGFEVDPGELRLVARDVSELAARLDALAREAAMLAKTPMRQHFPELARAQEAARRWDAARDAIAVAMGQVTRALGRLNEGVTRAARDYEAVDSQAAQRNEDIGDQAA